LVVVPSRQFFVWVDVDAVVSDVSFFLVCDAAAAVTTTLL
jgi:hypothetical protein